jgi:alpha-mannosidase
MDAIRVEEFCASVLMPLAMPQVHPLRVSVVQLPERVSPDDGVRAVRSRGRPVDAGFRWGPVWSTAWFRVRGSVPSSFAGERVLLRFSSGTEACLWRDGEPVAGFDPYHDTASLWPSRWSGRERARGGERIDLAIEAACNMPLGATTFWWDQPEVRARWAESAPGRLERAEIVTFDEAVWTFAQRLDWLRRMLWSGREDDARTNDIRAGLSAIVRAIPAQGCTRRHVLAQSGLLEALLHGRAGAEHPAECVAIGHAHIDTAWLWRIGETRRKCVRSFATALASIDRFPHFRFLCSQAQQYEFVRQESPALFARIRDAVHAGRWEAAGAMWVEPDGTCPSGESFVRQIVHGTRWWREHVGGPAARQRLLYLPDTFGFPACLPQIMCLAGIDTFITNKMIWGDTNRFPHVTFRWRGLGRAETLTHFTPGHNYNSDFLPADLTAAAANIESQDQGRVRTYLQPYGWGDGGGGPDPAQIERTRSAMRCEGMPAVTHSTVHDFCARLHAEAAEAEAAQRPLPVWDGELYLEAHRGTYTTQRWIKRANRRAEELLRQVEMVAVLAPLPRRAERALCAELDALWKVVLLHQFHDILPGSSIGPVYDDARGELGGAVARLEALRDEGLARIAAQSGGAGPLLLDPVRAAVLVDAERPHGSARGAAGASYAVSARSRRIGAGAMSAEFDREGRLVRLTDGTHDCSAAPGGALHELALYEDRPRRWEAWDTDREYVDKRIALAPRCTITSGVRGGTAWLRVERALGAASRIVQVHELRPGERMLRVSSRLEWREERTLLRALVHTGIASRHARFGTQFGWIDRDAHENTSWQRAQFEVPGHGWMCVHDGTRGLAVLDDGIFGKSARHGTLGLSLAKSPNFPDPSADRGTHEFSYAIMPLGAHERCASAAAERFARGPVHVTAAGRSSSLRATGSRERKGGTLRAGAPNGDAPHGLPGFARVDAAGHVEIAALKPADDGSSDVILRLVDHSGAPGRMLVGFEVPVRRVVRCDLHEIPLRGRAGTVPMRMGAVAIDAGPFEIVSLRIARGASSRRRGPAPRQ